MGYNYALIDKETLSCICRAMNVSREYISRTTGLDPDKMESWFTKEDASLPTIKQAKKIAACLHIPFAALYMNQKDINIPKLPKIRNMRTFAGEKTVDDSALNIAVVDLLLERKFFMDTAAEFEMPFVSFNPPVPGTCDPSVWARDIRTYFDISMDCQYRSTSARKFYLYLRNRIERKGVFVQCFTDVPLEDARGFAIHMETLPVIGVNDKDRPPAKSFSIIHELVHLYKRQSSMCNDIFNVGASQKEEIFCNAVAGELLVPERELLTVLEKGRYCHPFSISDISDISRKFSVSREVIVRRLLELKEIDEDEYDRYFSIFKKELEQSREDRRAARLNGMTSGIPRHVEREVFDRVSNSVSRVLYAGYADDVFTKLDIARHLSVAHKHIDKYLQEVAKWNS